jgi:hypothetical protein
MKLPIAALACGLALAVPAAGQVTVSLLARGTSPVAAAEGLRAWRFGDPGEPAPAAVGSELAAGDLLSGAGADLLAELRCAAGSRLGLRGPFRLAVRAPAAGAACEVDLLAGTVDVLTTGRVEVHAGGMAVGGEGVRYAVELVRSDGAPGGPARNGGGPGSTVAPSSPAASPVSAGTVALRVVVFDGRVEVSEAGSRVEVTAGQALGVAGAAAGPALAAAHQAPLAGEELERWAGRFAAFDAAKALAAGSQLPADSLRANLTELHAAVLRAPGERGPRLELARAESGLGNLDEMAFYEEKAGAIWHAPPGVSVSESVAHPAPASPSAGSQPAAVATPAPVTAAGAVGAKAAGAEPPPPAPTASAPAASGPAAEAPTAPAPVAGSARAEPNLDELRRWLDDHRFDDVIRVLEPRVSGGGASSVEILLLARAYAGLERWDRSSFFAVRALRRDETDDQLSARELAAAQYLRDKKR